MAEDLDMLRFERLLARGRAAKQEGDLESAATWFSRALSVWNGSPLGGVEEWFAQAARAHLQDVFVTAAEDYFDTALVLDRHGDVLDELRALVVAHPFRERLTGQLMVALCRTGRQVEAMDRYRSLWTSLRDEFGVPPTQELQGLHRSLLSQPETSGPTDPTAAIADADLKGIRRRAGTLLLADVALRPACRPTSSAAVARMVRRVRSLLIETVKRHDGDVLKVVDLGLWAVAPDPASALAIATAIGQTFEGDQRFDLDLQYRVALHRGRLLFVGEELSGPTLWRALELLRSARWGQTLVSQEAAATLSNVLSPELRLEPQAQPRHSPLAHGKATFSLSTLPPDGTGTELVFRTRTRTRTSTSAEPFSAP